MEWRMRIEVWRKGVTVEARIGIEVCGVELLDVRVGLSGELLIQQEVLLPEKFNLSLGLSVLLLDRLKSRITSTNKTSDARMLRN